MRMELVVRRAAERTAKPTEPRKRGRLKGTKNKTRAEAELSPELLRIQAMAALLKLIAGFFPVTHLVIDGHFGNHPALQIVRLCFIQFFRSLFQKLLQAFQHHPPILLS
jgi:hypothetical protein